MYNLFCLVGLHSSSVLSQKIVDYAKATLEYLESREHFWRLQQPNAALQSAVSAKNTRKSKSVSGELLFIVGIHTN